MPGEFMNLCTLDVCSVLRQNESQLTIEKSNKRYLTLINCSLFMKHEMQELTVNGNY